MLLVDAYNLIHANTELKELARLDLGAAREKLSETVAEYAAMKGFEPIIVFDAYKIKINLQVRKRPWVFHSYSQQATKRLIAI